MSKTVKNMSRPPRRRSVLPTANVSPEHYRHLIGMPVCAVLKDGSVYIGTIADVDNGRVVLYGARSRKKLSRNPAQAKAQISAFGGLGSLFGGGGAAATGPAAGVPGMGGALGGMGNALGGLFGGGGSGNGGSGGGFNLGGMGRWINIGWGVVRFIFPLLKGFGW